MKKILILGASGVVGKPLFDTLKADYDVHGTYNRNKPVHACDNHWHHYDTAATSRLKAIMDEVAPDLVISSLNANFEQQLEAHKFLCSTSVQVVFISTANVFDGDIRGQHPESKATYPVSRYGRFKQACEAMFPSSLVIRLPKILDPATIDKWIQDAITGQPTIYSNLFVNFNTPENVANAIKYCVDVGMTGVQHLVSADCITVEDAVKHVLALRGTSAEYTPALLTIESYCELLGCDDPKLLRHSGDNIFNLGMICTNDDILSRFSITCADAIAEVCA